MSDAENIVMGRLRGGDVLSISNIEDLVGGGVDVARHVARNIKRQGVTEFRGSGGIPCYRIDGLGKVEEESVDEMDVKKKTLGYISVKITGEEDKRDFMEFMDLYGCGNNIDTIKEFMRRLKELDPDYEAIRKSREREIALGKIRELEAQKMRVEDEIKKLKKKYE